MKTWVMLLSVERAHSCGVTVRLVHDTDRGRGSESAGGDARRGTRFDSWRPRCLTNRRILTGGAQDRSSAVQGRAPFSDRNGPTTPHRECLALKRVHGMAMGRWSTTGSGSFPQVIR